MVADMHVALITLIQDSSLAHVDQAEDECNQAEDSICCVGSWDLLASATVDFYAPCI